MEPLDGYLAAGVLNALVGVGGAGKGTLMGWVIAKLTRGELPGHFAGSPANALIIGDEDNADTAWLPRLAAAGADLGRVSVVTYAGGAALDLVRDIDVLEHHVLDFDAQLIYIDQILDNLGANTDSYNAKDVRQGLAAVKTLAGNLDRTVAYTTHPNKTSSGGARDRIGGSVQFVEVARVVSPVGFHPDRDGYRAWSVIKTNTRRAPTLTFRIDPTFGFVGRMTENGLVGVNGDG